MASENLDITENKSIEHGAKLEATSAAEPKRFRLPVSNGNLMLIGMFVVAGVAVWILRAQVGPETASAEQQQAEVKIGAALAMINGSMWGKPAEQKTESVLKSFHYKARDRQIPISNLTGNPFRFKLPKLKKPSKGPRKVTKTPTSKTRYAHEEHLARALAVVGGLKLQSVLVGPSGDMAMISGNLIAKGQEIEGWVVSEIGAREVVLTWGARKHVLYMHE